MPVERDPPRSRQRGRCRDEPGQVTSADATLPVPGTWTFTVTAPFGDFDQTVFVGAVTIN